MKTYTSRVLTTIGLIAVMLSTLPLNASVVLRSVEEYDRKISKQFTVDPNASVTVKNKYGKIHVNTWDKNEVTLEVVMSVDAKSAEVAEEIFDKIEIQTEATSKSVSFQTYFRSKVKDSHKNKDLQIDYTVNMPRKASVELRNRFGDVYLGDILGSCKIDIAYGSLRAGNLDNKSNTVDLQFSDGQIKFIALGKIDLQYSELKIQKTGSLNIDSQFSELDVGPAGELTIDSQYDEMDLDGAAKIKADAQFSEIEIEQLTEELTLVCGYTDIKVRTVAPSMKMIFVDNQFGDVELGIASGSSYTLDAKGSFADIDLPSGFKIREKTKGTTSWHYIGTVGDDPEDRTITVITSYGDVDLD